MDEELIDAIVNEMLFQVVAMVAVWFVVGLAAWWFYG